MGKVSHLELSCSQITVCKPKPALPGELPAMQGLLYTRSSTVAASHTWLLSTQNVANATEDLNFSFHSVSLTRLALCGHCSVTSGCSSNPREVVEMAEYTVCYRRKAKQHQEMSREKGHVSGKK